MAYDPKLEQFIEECAFAKVVLMENDEEALLIGGRVIRLVDSRFTDYLSRALRRLSQGETCSNQTQQSNVNSALIDAYNAKAVGKIA